MTALLTSKKAYALWAALSALALLAPLRAVRAQDLPRYKVDPTWPKQLPNNWAIGGVGGIFVDSHDHAWVIHRALAISKDDVGAAQNPPWYPVCCTPAPAVLEFDWEGKLMQAWGGPGFVADWPGEEHGIYVDKEENVWVGGNGPLGRGAPDRQMLKFTNDGKKLLMEIGYPSMDPQNNQNTAMLGGAAGMDIDEKAHEVYIADGYVNKRVVVYDSETGVFKRGWGAYGIPLSEIDNLPSPPFDPEHPVNKQFWGPVHCIHLSVDNLVYVCDRSGDRIQVFTKQGKFVHEFWVIPKLEGDALCSMLFSHDPQQKYLLVGACAHNLIYILNRSDGKIVGTFGRSGHGVGEFENLHAMAMDSHGNIYVGETSNKRVSRFLLENAAGSREVTASR